MRTRSGILALLFLLALAAFPERPYKNQPILKGRKESLSFGTVE